MAIPLFRSGKPSFADSLILRAALLMLLALALFAAGSYQFIIRPTVNGLAEAEMRLVSQQLEARVSGLLNGVETTLRSSRGWGADGSLDHSQLLRFNEYFFPIIANHPEISSVNFAHESGREILLLHNADGTWVNRLSNPDRWGQRTYWLFWSATHKLERVEMRLLDYDTRKRPWHRGAMALTDEGKIFWTAPYIFFTTTDPGITAAMRWTGPDGSRYVIGHDVRLIELAAFTATLTVGEEGRAVLFQDDGKVLAPPHDKRFGNTESIRAAVLKTPAELGLDDVAQGLAAWQGNSARPDVISTFRSGERGWLSLFRQVAAGEQRFWLGVFAPKSEFLPTAGANLAALVGIALFALLVGMVVTFRIARRFGKPLVQLARETQRIGRKELDAPVVVDAPWWEIRQLADAQEAMRVRLRDANALLEAEVADRTLDLRKAEREAQQARAEAEAAAAAKADFLANMSHEIRTPMNAIIGLTHIALQTDMTAKQRGYLEKVDAASKSLLGIINDILDFSKIEAGMMPIEVVDFSLGEVIERVVDLSLHKAEDKGLRLRVDCARDVPDGLRGDPLRIQQVLLNLVSNALKFTEAGEVVIGVRRAAAADGLRLHFEVSDTGIGMNEEERARLFAPFTQADTSTTRRYGGTGLGLSICKRLIGLMGGEIGVDSTPGKGSRFFFDIPVEPGAAPGVRHRATKGDAMPAILRGKRVLLVEDNAVNREMAAEILGGAGLVVDTAANGLEAVERAARGYDAILMDCNMPVMDGFEATRRIRASGRAEGLPILAMTASVLLGDRELCLQAGMDDHVAKPIDVAELYAKLARWIGGAGAAAEPRVDEPPSPPLAVLDRQAALARMGGNADLYQRLLTRFREDQGDAVRRIRSALAAGDRDTARRHAHTLKGLAGNIGADVLMHESANIEHALAAGEDVVKSLPALAAVLERVLAIIDGRPAAGAVVLVAPAAGQTPFATGLAKLYRLLCHDDADAVHHVAALRPVLVERLGAESTEKLVKSISRYEFDGAVEQLRTIAERAGISLDSSQEGQSP